MKEKENISKKQTQFCLLRLQRFGNTAKPYKKNIKNLYDHKLSLTEEFVLSHKLNFCLLPTNPKRRKCCRVWSTYCSTSAPSPSITRQHSALKATLSDLAHAYCGTPVDADDFLMHRELLSAIKSLQLNNNTLITSPDKGSNFVVLHKTDYVAKTNSILKD